jgi:hypothetical protein
MDFLHRKLYILGFLARVLNAQKEFKGKVTDSENEKDSIYILTGGMDTSESYMGEPFCREFGIESY